VADLETTSSDLSGRWVGFYKYRWEEMGPYPIVANFTQSGRQITGSMYDQITSETQYLDEYYEVVKQGLSDRQKYYFEMVIRRFGDETVRHSRLPDTSDLKGRVTGNTSGSPRHTAATRKSTGRSGRKRSPLIAATDTRSITPATWIRDPFA
jgi:hypothetical protein